MHVHTAVTVDSNRTVRRDTKAKPRPVQSDTWSGPAGYVIIIHESSLLYTYLYSRACMRLRPFYFTPPTKP